MAQFPREAADQTKTEFVDVPSYCVWSVIKVLLPQLLRCFSAQLDVLKKQVLFAGGVMSLAASLEGMAITITSSALASRHQRSEDAVTVVKLECKEFTRG